MHSSSRLAIQVPQNYGLAEPFRNERTDAVTAYAANPAEHPVRCRCVEKLAVVIDHSPENADIMPMPFDQTFVDISFTQFCIAHHPARASIGFK
jgi:hypothetical protein